MKFRIERSALSDAAQWVAGRLPQRPPAPVLGGVLVETSDDGLRLSVFDYETSARVLVPCTVADEGRALVSARLLADVAKALPSQPVEVTVDGSRATIQCGSSRFSLPTMPVEDYPRLPAMPDVAGTIPADRLAEAVAQVAVAAGRDDTLPMLTGIRIEIAGGRLTLAATDRFRLAVREIDWAPADPDLEAAVLVPARTLAELAKTLAGSGDITVSLDEGTVGFERAGRRATTRLLDAEFPRYRQLIPKDHSSAVLVDVGALVEAIKRVDLVTDRVAQVRLAFSRDGLRLSAGGDEVGSAEEDVPADLIEGDPVTIAFNPGYLLDALGSLHTGRARLTFTTPNRPALVRPVHPGDDAEVDPALITLLMPVRLPG